MNNQPSTFLGFTRHHRNQPYHAWLTNGRLEWRRPFYDTTNTRRPSEDDFNQARKINELDKRPTLTVKHGTAYDKGGAQVRGLQTRKPKTTRIVHFCRKATLRNTDTHTDQTYAHIIDAAGEHWIARLADNNQWETTSWLQWPDYPNRGQTS